MKPVFLLLTSLLLVRLGFSQDRWYRVGDSLYEIRFPAKPFTQEGKNLKKGNTRTIQMDYRDYRMNYLFLIRINDTTKLDDKTVRISALIQNIAEICVSLNYSLDKPDGIKAAFKNFHTIDTLPYSAAVAEYHAKSATTELTMRAEAFFVDERMYLAVVYSQGDRLFDLKRAAHFFNSLKLKARGALKKKAPKKSF